HAGVAVDAHQHHALDAQGVQQLAQVGTVEAVEPLLVVDDVIGLAVELGDDLRAGRAFEIVLAHGALPPRRQPVRLALRRVHRLPVRRQHAFTADIPYFSVNQNYMDHRDLPG